MLKYLYNALQLGIVIDLIFFALSKHTIMVCMSTINGEQTIVNEKLNQQDKHFGKQGKTEKELISALSFKSLDL